MTDRRHIIVVTFGAVVVLGILMGSPQDLRAATAYRWNNPLGGDFDVGANWTPTGPPVDAPLNTVNTESFDLADSYTVTFNGDVDNDNKLFVKYGAVSFVSAGGPHTYDLALARISSSASLTIGDAVTSMNMTAIAIDVYSTAELNIVNGDLQSWSAEIHSSPTLGAAGRVTVSQGTWTNGSRMIVGGILTINSGGIVSSQNSNIHPDRVTDLSSVVMVDGGTWTNSGSLEVGDIYTVGLRASLDVRNGGQVSSDRGRIDPYGQVTINAGTWTNDSELLIDGDLLVTGGGAVSSPESSIGSDIDYSGTATIDGGAWSSDNLYIGGSDSLAGGTGQADVANGSLNVSGMLRLWSGGTLNITTGDVTVGVLANSDGGTLNLGDGSLTVTNSEWDVDTGVGDSRFMGGSAAIDSAASLTVTKAIHVGDSGDHSGSLTVSDQASVTTEDELIVGSRGELTLNGGRIAAPLVRVASSGSLGGHGTVEGKIVTAGEAVAISANGGTLTLGDPNQFSAFNHGGELHVGTAAVVLKTRGFANLGSLTTLEGGTLSAANGIVLGTGRNLVGSGEVEARVAAGFGATIEATGALTLGDTSAFDGFFSDGTLATGANEVTVNDANMAVLGSLTMLGDGVNGGTLTAGNADLDDRHSHFLVAQGKTLAGRGTVNGHFKNHGDVIGDGVAADERIFFESDWTVTGKGVFEYVGFKGTFAPGDSPTITSTTHALYSNATIEIELGGTLPGSDNDRHDQINDTATMWLDHNDQPTLSILPWDNFIPEIGDEFTILTWQTGLDGTFGSVVVDPWFTGRGIDFDLQFNNVADAGDLTLKAVPEPATLSLLLLGGLAILKRRRSEHPRGN